jgi:hypothetical protein
MTRKQELDRLMMEKLDHLAKEMYGEFGFLTCSDEEQNNILSTLIQIKYVE